MRTSLRLLAPLLLLASACSRPPPAPPAAPPPAPAPKAVVPPVEPATAPATPPPSTHPDEARVVVPSKPFPRPSAAPIVFSDGPVKQARARAPGELATFHGFSGDGTEFAYAAWSEGAGFAILHVISSASSEQVKDFRLETPAAISDAEAYLASKGYAAANVEPPARLGDRKLEVSVQGLTTTVKLAGQPLWSGNAFGSAVPSKNEARAVAVAWSPDGKKVAVRADLFVGAEFGRATGVRVVEVP